MIKHLPLTLFLFLLLSTPVVKSQDKIKIDSLENQLKSHQNNDTAKVNLLINIASEVSVNDNIKALNYSQQAVKLAVKLNYKKGIVKSLCALGLANKETNKNLAIGYVTKALRIAEISKFNSDIANSCSILGTINNSTDKNKALNYHLKAINLAKKANDQQSVAKYLYKLGELYLLNGEFDKSTATNLKALRIAKIIGDKSIENNCTRILGLLHNFQGKYPQALEYYLKYLSAIENTNNKLEILRALSDIGCLYSNTSDYAKSNSYHKRALKIANELKDKRKIFMCYSNIGLNYRKKHDPRAIECLEKALRIAKEINDTMLVAFSLRSLAPLYVQQGKLDLGLEFYQKSLKLYNNKLGDCRVFLEMGNIYLLQKQYAASLSYTLKSLDLANKMNIRDFKIDVHKQLSEIYAATKNFSKAYYHHKRFAEINDSIYNEKNVKKIAELEYTYKFEKEKQAIELVQQKKNAVQRVITLSLLGGILLVLLFAVYVFCSLLKKRSANILLIKQKSEIEKLNEEYKILNEEYLALNEQLKLSNIQINNELELNQKSMTAAALKLIQNSERDAITIDRLHEIEKYAGVDAKGSINALISDYKHSSYNSNWEEFEILFEKVHSSFYEELNTQFPTLTTNERKLCAFLKLNMNSKDIAHITFQSDEALKKARLRLRKKLMIDRETNLTAFLQKL